MIIKIAKYLPVSYCMRCHDRPAALTLDRTTYAIACIRCGAAPREDMTCKQNLKVTVAELINAFYCPAMFVCTI